ncbi:MAG: MFS transporter [Halanaerobiales bacterium]
MSLNKKINEANLSHINLFLLVTGLFWFSMYAYIPTFSPYLKSLGISDKFVGIIVGSYGFSQMIIRIPLGIYSDRINRRKVFIIAGVILGALSSGWMFLFNNPYLILLFRSIAGIAAATWITFTVLFSSYYKDSETSKSIGIINSFTKLGQVIAMLGGGIIAQRFGQEYPFLMAAVGGFVGLILSFGIKEKRKIDHKPMDMEELISIAKNPGLLSVSFLAIILQLITFATTFGFIPIVAENLGANSIHLGLITVITVIPAIFSSYLSGTFFASRYGERNTIVGGFILIALSCVVVPFINDLSILYGSQIINGTGQGIVFPILMGLSIKNVVSNKRGTAMGFFQAIYGLGMFLGPVLLGFLSYSVGISIGFYIIGLIGFLGGFLTLIFCRNAGRQMAG